MAEPGHHGTTKAKTDSLGEIASRVGYESESAFSNALRRRFDAPPGGVPPKRRRPTGAGPRPARHTLRA